jgi:hypothetical protein
MMALVHCSLLGGVAGIVFAGGLGPAVASARSSWQFSFFVFFSFLVV